MHTSSGWGDAATIVGVAISLVTAYWAKSFPSIMDYMQAIFSWVNAPLFATMLLGMFVRWITPNGAFWGLIAGMGSSFTLFLAVKYNWIDATTLTFRIPPAIWPPISGAHGGRGLSVLS